MKEYNPSDSQETSVYEINRRGVLGLFVTSAGAMALTACGGKKETTSEQTSGQLSEHVDSDNTSSSSEVSPTPKGPKTLESHEFHSEAEVLQAFFENRIPDKDKFRASICIPERVLSNSEELPKAFAAGFEAITNVFAFGEEEQQQGLIPVSEVEKVWRSNEFGPATATRGALKVSEEVTKYLLKEYCTDSFFKQQEPGGDGRLEPIESVCGGFYTWVERFVSAQMSLQRQADKGSFSVESPADLNRCLNKIKIEGFSAEKQNHTDDGGISMRNVTLRPHTNYDELVSALEEPSPGNPKGSLNWVMGASADGMTFEAISLTPSKTNPGTAVVYLSALPKVDDYQKTHAN